MSPAAAVSRLLYGSCLCAAPILAYTRDGGAAVVCLLLAAVFYVTRAE